MEIWVGHEAFDTGPDVHRKYDNLEMRIVLFLHLALLTLTVAQCKSSNASLSSSLQPLMRHVLAFAPRGEQNGHWSQCPQMVGESRFNTYFLIARLVMSLPFIPDLIVSAKTNDNLKGNHHYVYKCKIHLLW